MIEDTTQHMQYTTYFKLNMTRNRYSCSSRFFFIDTTLMSLNLNHWTVQSIPLYRSLCGAFHITLWLGRFIISIFTCSKPTILGIVKYTSAQKHIKIQWKECYTSVMSFGCAIVWHIIEEFIGAYFWVIFRFNL